MAAVSCIKDINNEVDNQLDDVQLVPMTFTAVSEGNELPTKALITSDGSQYSMQWKGDESISVLSASKTTAQKFDNTTTTGGKNAVFSGFAASDPTYYAVYPHNDAITLSESTINNVTIPANQTATAGTFDPNAYIAVAQSSTEEFSFKTVCAMVRFSLTDVEGVTKVTFSGNNGETLACTGDVTFNGSGIPSHAYASNASKVITLQGTFTSDTDYYIVFRAGSLTNGMTLTIHTATGPKNYITKSAELTGIRNKVINLGNLNERTGDNALKTGTPNDLYVAYLHGYDVMVGTQTINKSSYSAELISVDTENKNIKTSLAKGGVYFIDQKADCSFTNGSVTDLQASLYLINRYADTRSTFKPSAFIRVMGNTVGFKNVDIDMTGIDGSSNKAYLFSNQNSTTDNGQLIFDNISITNISNPIYYGSDKSKALNSIISESVDFKQSTGVVLFNLNNTTVFSSYNTISFNNCIFYTAESNSNLVIINAGSSLQASSNTITLQNNSFYCVMPNNAYIIAPTVGTFNFTNNLVGLYKITQKSAITNAVITTKNFTNNLYYIKTSGSYAMKEVLSDGQSVTNDEKYRFNTSYPFKQHSGYETYGATR